MMKQYYSIKREHPDALLMFRMGDFYETFGEDARTVSRELDIVLTARDRKSKNPVPLAGIPYHALDSYLAKLIRRGYRVAICDQLEDPQAARGLVKRGVVRVVSPGTIVEGALLDAGHNFLAAVLESDGRYGLALLDISTGDFRAAQFAILYAPDVVVWHHRRSRRWQPPPVRCRRPSVRHRRRRWS